MSYAFSDTPLARKRLEILNDVFAPATHLLLRDGLTITPRRVVDLGCGPGYTTRLLGEALHGEEIIGLDISEHFVEFARQGAPGHMAFYCHDITAVPFPVEAADLLYCRFLLTHLSDVAQVIANWATQLRSGGLLLIEEVEWIETTNQTFARYLQIVDTMLEAQSNRLYIGPELDEMTANPLLRLSLSRVQRLPVRTGQAASMFLPSLRSWRNRPFIEQHYEQEELAGLEQSLQGLMASGEEQGVIEWGMRQIVLQRV